MRFSVWGFMSIALYFGVIVPVACLPSSGTLGPRAEPSSDASAPLRNDDETDIPCAARYVLQTVCQQCHTQPPANGAPFPLQTRSDVLAEYGGMVIRDDMIEQLEAERM